MRITKIDITGFGAHAGVSIPLPSDAFTVFFGANERGKTTLAAFINYLLYGKQTLIKDNMYEPAAAVRHGGALTFTSGGHEYTITRFYKPRKKELDIRQCDASIEESVYEADLLHGVSLQNFDSVFSIDVDELSPVKNAVASQFGEIFYDTIGGEGKIVSPRAALKRLEADRDSLYKLTSKKRLPVVQLLKELDALDERISLLRRNSGEYRRKLTERDELTTRAMELSEQLHDLAAEERDKNLVLNLKDKFFDWQSAKARLEQSGQVKDFPERGIELLDRYDKEIIEIRKDSENLKRELEKESTAFDASAPNRLWLENQSAILALHQEKSSIETERKHEQEQSRKAEDLFHKCENDLERELPGRTREHIEEAAGGIIARGEIKAVLDKRQQALEQVKNIQSEINDADKRAQEDEQEVQDVEARIEQAHTSDINIPPESIRTRIETWLAGSGRTHDSEIKLSELKSSRVGKWASLETRANSLPGRSATSIAPFTSIAGIIALVAGIILFVVGVTSGPNWSTMIAGAVTAVISTLLIIASRQSASSLSDKNDPFITTLQNEIQNLDQQIQNLNRNIEAAHAETAALASELGLPQLDQDSARRLLDRIKEQQSGKQHLQDELEKQRASAQKWHSIIESLEQNELSAAQKELNAVDQQLSGIKSNLGIPADVPPETVLQFCDTVADIKKDFAEADALAQSAQKLGERISNYEDRVRDLARLVQFPDADTTEPLTLVTLLSDELERQKNLAQEQNKIAERIKNLENNIKGVGNDILSKQKQRTDLLAAGGAADDPAAFRDRAALFQEFMSARDEFRSAEKLLLSAIPEPADKNDFIQRLTQMTPEQWDALESDLESLREEKETLEQSRDDNNQAIGTLKREIHDLLSADELPALEQERESRIQELEDLTEQWNALALAAGVMEIIAGEDEARRMPDIKKFASELFAEFTSGSFNGLEIDTAGRTLTGLRPGGERVPPERMSRSVRQELFLAIRLAQVLHLAAEPGGGVRETMPMIMDDVLVDIDDDRLPRVITTMHNRFKPLQTQVIFFTAHSHIRDAFAEVAGDSAIVNL